MKNSIFFTMINIFFSQILILSTSQFTLSQDWNYTKVKRESVKQDPDSIPTEDKFFHYRYRIYSDFVGINDDQPNGLLQTEIYFSWPLSKNTYEKGPKFFNNLVIPDFAILKIDDKNRFLNVIHFPDTISVFKKGINSLQFLQYASLRSSAKLNILKLKFSDYSVYLDILGSCYRTGINDTTKSEPEKFINSFGAGLNFFVNSRKFLKGPTENLYGFKLDLVFTIFWHDIISNEYTLVKVIQDDLDERLIKDKNISEYKGPLSIIQTQVVYNPPDQKTEYFLRFSYFTYLTALFQNREFEYSFIQLQLGISKLIDENFFGKKENK